MVNFLITQKLYRPKVGLLFEAKKAHEVCLLSYLLRIPDLVISFSAHKSESYKIQGEIIR